MSAPANLWFDEHTLDGALTCTALVYPLAVAVALLTHGEPDG